MTDTTAKAKEATDGVKKQTEGVKKLSGLIGKFGVNTSGVDKVLGELDFLGVWEKDRLPLFLGCKLL